MKDTYRILVEQIPAVVFLAFFDQGISEAYVSPQIEHTLGFTQEEWLQDPVQWYHRIHPDDKERWSVEAARMFLTGESLRSVYRVLARDGRVVWFHCEVKMARHTDGRPWFIHGVGFDITELKQAEEALSRSEELLRGIFEYAPDTMVVVDCDGRIERVNAQVERMFGYRPDELPGKPIELLLPERFRQQHVKHRDHYLVDPHLRPMGIGQEALTNVARHSGQQQRSSGSGLINIPWPCKSKITAKVSNPKRSWPPANPADWLGCASGRSCSAAISPLNPIPAAARG